MTKEEVIALLTRYEAGTCSERERVLLETWFAKRVSDGDWQWKDDHERHLVHRLMRSRIEDQLFPKKTRAVVSLNSIKKLAVAAVIVCCSAIAVWMYLNQRASDSLDRFYTQQAVKPGSNAALLTLADGKTIRLDEVQSGTLYHERGVVIKKLESGKLQYEAGESGLYGKSSEAPTNTLSVPRGGQYQLTLPDGTKAWLNSATTLVYPTAFTGNDRLVTLSGEAYFEVAKNEAQPFKVKTSDTDILVTGTHFNVTAYPDEERVVTTLLEGSVQVFKERQSIGLSPGQQAITTTSSEHILKKAVDTDFALAWVRGDFLFEDQDIQTIMKSVSRWYNVDVAFDGKIPHRTYGGSYTKSKGLHELIHHLKQISELSIELVEERRVIVMP